MEYFQRQDLSKVMSKVHGNLCQYNIVLHGPPGAGKSSLMRLIAGSGPLRKHVCTQDADNVVHAVHKIRMKQFKIIEKHELIDMLANFVKNSIVDDENELEKKESVREILKEEEFREKNACESEKEDQKNNRKHPEGRFGEKEPQKVEFKEECIEDEMAEEHLEENSIDKDSEPEEFTDEYMTEVYLSSRKSKKRKERKKRHPKREQMPGRKFRELTRNTEMRSGNVKKPKTLSPAVQFPEVSAHSISRRSLAVDIKKKMKISQPSLEAFSLPWQHVVDSGGQPHFHDILPLAYPNTSLFILVIRLIEGLNGKLKVCICKDHDIYPMPDDLVLTNQEYIVRMCRIAASCVNTANCFPHVMIVGTHKGEGIFKTTNGKSMVREINEGLKNIRKEFENVLLCKSDDETIFDINTMATGEEHQMYTEELQKCISGVLTEKNNMHSIPLKWLAFQLDLDQCGGVVRMSKCYQDGHDLGMSREDVRDALLCFSRAALLLYYPDDIPDLVLTNVDPIMDRLSRLVIATLTPNPNPSLHDQSERLRKCGLFNKNVLSKIYSDIQCHDLSDYEFLKLLECLRITANVQGEEYFLPCALSSKPPLQSSDFEMQCFPLVFTWNKSILPHGFFFTVAFELLCNSNNHENDVHNFTLCTNVVQWQEEIQMFETSGKIPGFIKLRNRVSWIQVSHSDSPEYCPIIYKSVNVAIQKTIKLFKPQTNIGSPTVTCLCPQCETKDHYCILSKDWKEYTCSLHESRTKPVSPKMSCWWINEGNLIIFYLLVLMHKLWL